MSQSGSDYLSPWMGSLKVDPGLYAQAWSHGKYDKKSAPNGHTFDVYGRSNLCANSVFNLYPGSADCYTCGLIDTETTLRPPYYNSIGGYCDDSYRGGADNNVLGYPGGPRGKASCPDKYAASHADCSKLSGQEQNECESRQRFLQMKSNPSMAQQ